MKISDRVYIHISTTDAEKGCTRIIDSGGLANPIRINIPSGVKNGTVLEIENAEYQNGDVTINQSLFVCVFVVKTKEEIDKENVVKKTDEPKPVKIPKRMIIIGIAVVVVIVVVLIFALK